MAYQEDLLECDYQSFLRLECIFWFISEDDLPAKELVEAGLKIFEYLHSFCKETVGDKVCEAPASEFSWLLLLLSLYIGRSFCSCLLEILSLEPLHQSFLGCYSLRHCISTEAFTPAC